MSLKPLLATLLAAATLVPGQAQPQTAPTQPQAAPRKIAPIKFTDTTLDNGLRVIISEDHDTPIYAIAVSYKVGSRDERAGRTGFAHLFEHMMFKGSENIGPGEHFYLVFTKGGSMNGTTNNDRTLYFEIMPKNQLDLGLFLEADRMRSLNVTKENLDNQRQAVKEERRLGIDNQPYGLAYEKMDELIYDNFAYKHSVIGSMADLDAASVDDVKQFFKTYYAPNNAVLALVGDLDTKDTLARVKKYFGAIPRQEPPKPVDLTEPEKTAERRVALDDKLARLTRISLSYRIPETGNHDARALSVLASTLGGESGRLYQKLVKEKEVVTSVSCFAQGRAGPSTFSIDAMVRPGKTAEEVDGLISEEIAKILAEPVTAKELERARIGMRRAAVSPRGSVLQIANSLADNAALYNDPNRINAEYEKRLAVTPADMQKAAKTYLRTANRAVVISKPAAPAAAPMPMPKQN